MAARALLASRRLRPRLPWAVLAFIVAFGAVYAVRGPWAHREAEARRAATLARATERDTFPLVAAMRQAEVAVTARDSVLRALQFAAEARRVTPALTPEQQALRDSLRTLLTPLDAALERAAKAPLPASYRSLAATRALRALPGVQALADTLTLLDRARQALDPVEAPQSEFARLSQRANAIGAALQSLGQSRRGVLQRQMAAVDTAGSMRDTLSVADTLAARLARDSARVQAARADSVLRAAREWHAALQRSADSVAQDRAARILGTSPISAACGAMLLVLAVAFTLAVSAEARAPTIAHAREIERITGVPVLATAHDFRVPREGRARLQPGTGVDPFRMVYLALTASGTRERTVNVTGDDVGVAAVVAARLAVSAAADEHATLLVDLAPGVDGAAAHFGARDEPGFTEAIAAVRLWREVARPIGASEGMAIDVVPAGAPRHDTDESLQSASARAEFELFAGDYDFVVLAAPTSTSALRATALVADVPTIIAVRLAHSKIQVISDMLAKFRAAGVRLHGFLLVEEVA